MKRNPCCKEMGEVLSVYTVKGRGTGFVELDAVVDGEKKKVIAYDNFPMGDFIVALWCPFCGQRTDTEEVEASPSAKEKIARW